MIMYRFSFEEGKSLAAQIGASAYLECSALNKIGIREVFEASSKAAMNYKETRWKISCSFWKKQSNELFFLILKGITRTHNMPGSTSGLATLIMSGVYKQILFLVHLGFSVCMYAYQSPFTFF